MIKSKSYLFCFFFVLLAGCGGQNAALLYGQNPAFYAYALGEVEGEPTTCHNAEVFATPASCQKVITALLAYKALGAEHRYETNLYLQERAGKITGAVIEFMGDPTFTSQDLAQLLSPLKGLKLEGPLVLDATAFKVPPYSPNNMIGDMGTDFSQPVSAMIIDGNIPVMPGEAGIAMDLEAYAIQKVQGVLQGLGQHIPVVMGTKKAGAFLVNRVFSKPLGETLPPALKRSDNLFFDVLYLKLVYTADPAGISDWTKGDAMIKALLLKHFGIEVPGAQLLDGSGSSRYNRIQLRQLFQILQKGYKVTPFLQALPYSGEKASSLLKRTGLPKHIRAKTGAMSGIACLCGYGIKENKPHAFVMVMAGFQPPQKAATRVIDDFVAGYFAG